VSTRSVSLNLPEISPLATVHWDGHQTAHVGAGNEVANVDFKPIPCLSHRLGRALGIKFEDVGAALLVAKRGADRRLGDAGLVRARRALRDVTARVDRNEQRSGVGW
jgi:hypothetical protein